MTKSHKKKDGRPNGKVTDFFQPMSSSQPPSSQPSSSQPGAPKRLSLKPGQNKQIVAAGSSQSSKEKAKGKGKAKARNNIPRLDQEVISITSDTSTHATISISSDSVQSIPPPSTRSQTGSKPRVVMAAVEITSPRRSSRTRSPVQHRPVLHSQPSSSISTRSSVKKEQGKAMAGAPSSLPYKRKKKFESEGEEDEAEVMVLPVVKRAPTAQPVSSSPSQSQSRSKSKSPSKSPSKPLAPRENFVSPGAMPTEDRDKPSPNKKLRLSSEPELQTIGPLFEEPVNPHQENGSEEIVIVPSSQSDEHELSLPRTVGKDGEAVKKSVERWIKSTSPRPAGPNHSKSEGGLEEDRWWDAGNDFSMDVDQDEAGPLSVSLNREQCLPPASPQPSSSCEVSTYVTAASTLPSRARTPPRTPPRPHTPPPTHHTPPPPLLTPHTKTNQIIAVIKARAEAAAAAKFSPEDDSIGHEQFKEELSDSSEEEDDDLLAWAQRGKGNGKATVATRTPDKTSTSISTDATSPLTPLTRTNSNCDRSGLPSSSRSTSPSPSGRVTRARAKRTVQVPSRVPMTVNQVPANQRPKKKIDDDPLGKLLKEKKLADKQGRGWDNMEDAERVFNSIKDHSGWSDEEDEDGLRSPFKTPRRRRLSPGGSMSPGGDDEWDSILDQENRERLLGTKNGGEVARILETDRGEKVKGKMRANDTTTGIPLWDSHDDSAEEVMDNTVALVCPAGLEEEDHYVVRIMKNGGSAGISLVFGSGLLATLGPNLRPKVLEWACSLALSSKDESISNLAFRGILSCLECSDSDADTRYDFVLPLLLRTIARLGAKMTVIGGMGWTPRIEHVKQETPSYSTRERVLYILVTLISAFAESNVIPHQDVPDALLAVLLIGCDPSASPELQRNVFTAIDVIGTSFPTDFTLSRDLEHCVGLKLLKLVKEVEPVNKAFLLSFLMAGCSTTRRIARWVAHAMLTSAESTLLESYTQLPPLDPLHLVLSPSDPNAPFNLSDTESVDYDDLCHYIEVLSLALTDIDKYVAQEKNQASSSTGPTSPRKGGAKELTPLEMIKELINLLNGKIVDTRAAHLDRSRAKASLQRLSMRIHYQRLAALKLRSAPQHLGLAGRARTLRDHWTGGGSSC